jgi:hypothetical protein
MAEELDEIEALAYKYMSAEDIAIIRGIDVDLIRDKDHYYGLAFLKGKLLRKAAFNYAVIRLSDQLSSPAQAIELKLARLNDIKGITG